MIDVLILAVMCMRCANTLVRHSETAEAKFCELDVTGGATFTVGLCNLQIGCIGDLNLGIARVDPKI